MSCWVVPQIAAELWNVPLQQILDRINAGQIPAKNDLGRMFVDVAPDSPKIEAPRSLRPPPPPTFTLVNQEELAALGGGEEDEEDQTIDLGDWREARETAERRRRPPLAA